MTSEQTKRFFADYWRPACERRGWAPGNRLVRQLVFAELGLPESTKAFTQSDTDVAFEFCRAVNRGEIIEDMTAFAARARETGERRRLLNRVAALKAKCGEPYFRALLRSPRFKLHFEEQFELCPLKTLTDLIRTLTARTYEPQPEQEMHAHDCSR